MTGRTRQIARQIEKIRSQYYEKYYFLKTGRRLPESQPASRRILEVSEIDETVETIRVAEVIPISRDLGSERSDTPIDFSSGHESDNLLFEIKV